MKPARSIIEEKRLKASGSLVVDPEELASKTSRVVADPGWLERRRETRGSGETPVHSPVD